MVPFKRMMSNALLILIVGAVFLQVHGDELEGSGNAYNTLHTDDEDLAVEYSGSGDMTESTASTETIIEKLPDYNNEPEVNLAEKDGALKSTKVNLKEEEENLDEEEKNLKKEEEELDKEESVLEELEKELDDNNVNIGNGKTEDDSDIDDALEPEITTTTEMAPKEPKVVPKDDEDKTDEEVGNPDATVDLEEKNPSDKEPTNESIFGNNQFLVAIIIGGCIGLLFAVCVILLVVYRLKKKDEGSYALDEQKKLASPSYQYTQGQEYFA